MADTAENHRPKRDLRFAISVGLAIGVGIATGRALRENLTPKIGSIGAFFVSLLVTAVVAGVVAVLAHRLIKPGER